MMIRRIGFLLLPMIMVLTAVGQDEDIVAMEYYIDTDPGVGNGTAIAITQGTPQDIDFTINTSGLSVGFHVLVIRAQDSNGDDWGIQRTQNFYVSASAVTTNTIVELEYFFDTDPGYGNGMDISIGASENIEIDELISTSSLSAGFHVIHIRARDNDGIWGTHRSSVFYIDNLRASEANANLAGVEYFIDTDPGIGLATEIDISPAQAIVDQDFTLETSSLTNGNYTLGMRVFNADGAYSITKTIDFELCNGADANFTATTVCEGLATEFTDVSTNTMEGDTYAWDFDGDGNVDSNTVGDVSFTYPQAGLFTASLTIDRDGCERTTTLDVTVENIPVANAGIDQNITSNETMLNAAPAAVGETGTWTIVSGAGTFSDANSPISMFSGIASTQTELRWTVVNDAAGCEDADEVVITLDPLSTETDILSFSLTSQTGNAIIDNDSHQIDIEVESGTDISNINPVITVSQGATITPSGSQNFSNPVTYTVRAEDGVSFQNWVVNVSIEEEVLGLNENFISVYPNPTDDLLILTGVTKSLNLSLWDVSGKVVFPDISGPQISLKDLKSGTYILKVKDSNRVLSIRIIKNN